MTIQKMNLSGITGWVVFAFVGLLSTTCVGQKLLFHKNKHREVLYYVGDIVSFQIQNDKFTGQITGFQDSLILFRNNSVHPKEITHIYVDAKTRTWFVLRYKYQIILPIAGVGYLLADLINTGEVSKETLIFSSSLVGAGLLARWLISDKMKIKGRRKLVILD
jgi:hypothetical protein